MILDDVFSGLDATNEDRIFSRLLGKSGLLRRRGTTVILVTHAAHRLSYADHIVALSAHGTVSEQGTFGQLLANNGYVASLAARHREEADNVTDDEISPAKAKPADDTTRLNAVADLQRPIGNWAVYNYYFKSIGMRNVVAWSALMVCYSMLTRFPGKVILVAV
jgi:ATP-binding cassette subfamily C (CFTR/MRP) protein 1